jgi:hypothetical protein
MYVIKRKVMGAGSKQEFRHLTIAIQASIHRPDYYFKHNIYETEFCLHQRLVLSAGPNWVGRRKQTEISEVLSFK